jgi:hypothetical protein
MDTAAEMAKGNLDGDTCWMLFDMLKNRCQGGRVCVGTQGENKHNTDHTYTHRGRVCVLEHRVGSKHSNDHMCVLGGGSVLRSACALRRQLRRRAGSVESPAPGAGNLRRLGC